MGTAVLIWMQTVVEISKFLKNCDLRVCVKTNEPHCGPVDTTCDSGYTSLLKIGNFGKFCHFLKHEY